MHCTSGVFTCLECDLLLEQSENSGRNLLHVGSRRGNNYGPVRAGPAFSQGLEALAKYGSHRRLCRAEVRASAKKKKKSAERERESCAAIKWRTLSGLHRLTLASKSFNIPQHKHNRCAGKSLVDRESSKPPFGFRIGVADQVVAVEFEYADPGVPGDLTEKGALTTSACPVEEQGERERV